MRITGLIVLLVAISVASAQETTGRLHGRVLREERVAFAGATITVTGTDGTSQRVLQTDDRGEFRALVLPAGEYRAHVRSVGFRDVIVERVIVRLGQTTSLGEIVLRRVEVELSPVVITHDGSSIDPFSTTVGATLDVGVAEKLPIGRDYQSLLLLLPQVQQGVMSRDGIHIAGSTGLENAYYVDGVNVTEGYRNSGGISLPYSFIDHVELKTGGYEPEFGRALGGIVSAITRTGTNSHVASAFAHYTASSVGSNPARGTLDFGTGRYARYDVGLSFGGPIARDRLWYFLAYDAATATEDLRLSGSPHEDRTRTHQFAGKLTWRVDPVTSFTATVIGDPSRRNVVGNPFWAFPIKSIANPDPYLSYWNQGGVAVAIAGNRAVGTNLLLETGLSRAVFHDRTGARTSVGRNQPMLMDFVMGEMSGGVGNRWDRTSTRTALSIAGTYLRGPHILKAGVQYEDNYQDEDWSWPGVGPDGAGVIMRRGPSTYVGLLLNHQTRVHNRIPTVFSQASFLLHERLRLNGGLRWDGQLFSSPTTGHSSSIQRQFQPRVGAIFYPTGTVDQKIAASYGRFYEQMSNQPITWYWGGLHQHFFIYGQNPLVDASEIFQVFWDDVPDGDIRGQHYDELTLGYERTLPRSITLAVRGSRRRVREILAGLEPEGPPPRNVLANPGRGQFSELPRPISKYDAVQVSLGRFSSDDLAFMVSYVWSRKFGNYVGVRDQDSGNPNAHAAGVTPSVGLLPNDRTHDFKALANYRFRRPLSVGATFAAQSGQPLSEFYADNTTRYFLGRRGDAGRTPALWDLNLRGTYEVPAAVRAIGHARLVFDLLHVLGQRKALSVDELKFLAIDADKNPINPNPSYGRGLQFQPPMTVRVGVEIGSKKGLER